MLDVCVVGTGYVGLVTGTCLAEIGHDVTCVDAVPEKVASLRSGRMPIYEPGLNSLVAGNASQGRLRFTTNLAAAVRTPNLVLFIAVGTPTGMDGATADLKPLLSAVEEAARCRRRGVVDGFVIFVIKSTVPVGTCSKVEAMIAGLLPADSFAVVSNPEFLREGSAIEDFMRPDRIVVGSRSPEALSIMRTLYAPLTRQGHRMFEATSIETSELIKYASNIFLATKIGLINEFSRLCERIGADVEELAAAVGSDHRVGPPGLRAGPGFGGSCFPKDLRALVGSAAALGNPMPIAEAVIASNERQKRFMSERIVELLGGDVRRRRVAMLGLSFKAGTDDIREAPAISIIADLLEGGASIAAFDPAAGANAARLMPGIDCVASPGEALRDADAAVVATEWPIFATLDWEAQRRKMAYPLVIDLRNCLDGEALVRSGFDYVGLGRTVAPTGAAGKAQRHRVDPAVAADDPTGARSVATA